VVKDEAQVSLRPEESLRCGAREIPRSGGVVDFERLYQMHSRRVFRWCSHMVWDKAEAEDLTQEVFFQVFRKIDTFRGEAAFATWLHRVAVNVVLMWLRKRPLIKSSRGESPERSGGTDCATQEGGAPRSALTGVINRLDLQRALAQLPAGYRTVFVLHDVEGYGHSEIAQMLGVESGTTKSQLHKARLRLRDLLRGVGSRHPQAKVGRMSRNVAPKVLMERRVPKSRPSGLTPESASLRPTILKGKHDVHHGVPLPPGPGPEMTNSNIWR
jgi:RNA polymerase sigma-70 factor, ECF subfamily